VTKISNLMPSNFPHEKVALNSLSDKQSKEYVVGMKQYHELDDKLTNELFKNQIDNKDLLPLKLMLAVKYLKNDESKLKMPNFKNAFNQYFLSELPDEKIQDIFATCSFMDPSSINLDILDELYDNENLYTQLEFLSDRGYIDIDYTNDTISVTHRKLQEKMKKIMSQEARNRILNKLCGYFEDKVVEKFERNVKQSEKCDAFYKQIKTVATYLANQSAEFGSFLAKLNEKLGYYYLYYEVNLIGALKCFKQVNEIMNESNNHK
jgi:hypothetical protein